MLSVPGFENDQIEANGANPRPRADLAIDLNPLFKEVRLNFDLQSLVGEIVEQQAIHLFRQNKAVFGTAILLAHEMGLVAQTEIDERFVDGPQAIIGLYRESLKRIDAKLNAVAQAIVGEDDDAFEAIAFEFRVREEYGRSEASPKSVDLVMALNPRFTQLDLIGVDRELAKVVIGCIRYIQDFGEIGICACDIQRTGVGFFLEDELSELKVEINDGNNAGDRELAELFLERGQYPFDEITDDADYLEKRIEFLRRIINNDPEKLFGDIPDLKGIRAFYRLHKQQAAYVSSPWWPFIEESLSFIRFVEKIKKNRHPEFTLFDSAESIYSDCGIGVGHAIGFGFDWEEELVAEMYEDIANAGEAPMSSIAVDPIALNQTAEKLMILAKARGLIRLAEIIQINQQGNDD
ncbi:hypothetical protein A1507_11805 [Methylomonas koyamae]|uniref:Uncharacterized protein n=1 Tax=Methylomonas koyamae TaxID=702114 RepID=A0A177NDV3_9GAMM|nr:hypothetical protein [Methylomonas koyamae]OAI16237.1 hypothetical protein A1507_11805 [Methylomonas koyamae]